MTKRQVERWWRLHRSQDQPTQLDKFTGNLWLGTFYLYNFIFGLYVLWDKEWLWDMDQIVSGFELVRCMIIFIIISTFVFILDKVFLFLLFPHIIFILFFDGLV